MSTISNTKYCTRYVLCLVLMNCMLLEQWLRETDVWGGFTSVQGHFQLHVVKQLGIILRRRRHNTSTV